MVAGNDSFPTLPAGYATRSVAGGADVTLTSAEGATDIIELTGLLTGNVRVTIPAPTTPQIIGTAGGANFKIGLSWLKLIRNSTTGPFTLTVLGTAAGSGLALAQGEAQWVYSKDSQSVQSGTIRVGLSPQPNWYFDFDAGDDNNDGLTPTTPIKTWTSKPDGSAGEYLARTGLNPYWNAPITWTIKGTMPATDALRILGVAGPLFGATLQGTPSIKRTGVITGRQDRSPGSALLPSGSAADAAVASSTNTSPIVIATVLAHGLTPYEQVRIRNHAGNTNANGTWPAIVVIDPTHFSLTGSVGNGVGTASGDIIVNRRNEITDVSVLDWTADVGQMIEVQTATTRVYEGMVVKGPARGFIAKTLTAPSRAACSILGSRVYTPLDYPFGNTSEWPGPFPIGATYSILVLPKVHNLYIDSRMNPDYVGIGPSTSISMIDFIQPNFYSGVSPRDYDAQFGGWLTFDTSTDNLTPGATNVGVFTNMLVRQTFTLSGSHVKVFGLVLNSFCMGIGGTLTLYGTMFQNSSWQEDPGGSGYAFTLLNHHASYGISFFDCATPLQIGTNCSLFNESSISGTGNTGPIFKITDGGAILDSNPYSGARYYALTSTVPEVSIGGYTSLPAVDPVTFASTAPAVRLLSFANIFSTVAAGGFAGKVFDPRSPMTRLSSEL